MQTPKRPRTVNKKRATGKEALSTYSPERKSGSGNLIPATSFVAQGAKKATSKMKSGGTKTKKK